MAPTTVAQEAHWTHGLGNWKVAISPILAVAAEAASHPVAVVEAASVERTNFVFQNLLALASNLPQSPFLDLSFASAMSEIEIGRSNGL